MLQLYFFQTLAVLLICIQIAEPSEILQKQITPCVNLLVIPDDYTVLGVLLAVTLMRFLFMCRLYLQVLF